MALEDVVIEDLFGFFTSLNNDQRKRNDLVSINSIIPYLAFIISTNDKAFECVKGKMANWDKKKYAQEYKACPWVRCRFITRMMDVEKEKKIVLILLFLCSKEANDDDVFQILSAGWKRISLFVETKNVISIDEAPLRKRIEEKWVLCLLAYIRNKMIIESRDKKRWYEFSSELFFYFEYIIQLMDIDTIHSRTFDRELDDEEKLFFYIDENIEFTEDNISLLQAMLLLKEKERLIQKRICEMPTVPIQTTVSTKISIHSREVKNTDSVKSEKVSLEKQIAYYQNSNTNLEKQSKELEKENNRLRNMVDLLNEEISLLRTSDDEDIILEDECDWEYLHGKKIVICGGRLEWMNRIKPLFPQWKFIENDNIRFDGLIIKDDNIDAIVFNKRFVSHGLFYRVASQKAKGIPLIYISSSNVEFALQTICNKLKNIE